jgi:hypothetical protein
MPTRCGAIPSESCGSFPGYRWDNVYEFTTKQERAGAAQPKSFLKCDKLPTQEEARVQAMRHTRPSSISVYHSSHVPRRSHVGKL